MKNQIKTVFAASSLLLNAAFAYGGLDWTYGTLTNPDNKGRQAKSIAYSTSGNVFVAGYEENSSGSKLIVTRKFSSTGSLLATATNSYFTPVGAVLNDDVKSIVVDAAGNVYVFGEQYGGTDQGQDIVLIKYNSSLVLQWKKLIYNTSSAVTNYDDKPSKLLIDANDNVFVVGTWSKVSLFGTEEIFTRKYSASGTAIYTTSVPQAAGTTIAPASDVCLDNTATVTVCSNTSSGTIMYARISNTGNLTSKNFYSAPAGYYINSEPQVECTAAGIFYLSVAMQKSSNSDIGKIMTVKFNSSGVNQWERFTTEPSNQYPYSVQLCLDASGNIYTGAIFIGQNGQVSNFLRIYKMNTSGTSLWNYLATEPGFLPIFKTDNTNALFVAFLDIGTARYWLKKIDIATGNVLWSEDQTTTTPPGYTNVSIYRINDLSVNPQTTEVAYCGYLRGNSTGNSEYRWHIRKYAVTSPRLFMEATDDHNTDEDMELNIFPNPSSDYIYIQSNIPLTNSNLQLIDVTGKVVKEIDLKNNSSQQRVPLNDLPNGIYFVQIRSNEKAETQKIMVKH